VQTSRNADLSTPLHVFIFVGKQKKKKRALGKPRHRWIDSIKTDLGERGWGGTDWSDLAQDRTMVKAYCECGNEPSGSIKWRAFLKWFRVVLSSIELVFLAWYLIS
jgi:hypothetical protein